MSGLLAPGDVIACHGGGFGPQASVFALVGFSRTSSNGLPLPFNLGVLGLNGCFLYNDSVADMQTIADAQGNVRPYDPRVTLGIPINPALAGRLLQFQCAGIKPGVNPLGLATSKNVEVRLGTFVPLTRGFMAWYHHTDRDAKVAAVGSPAILAMRFN